jgi:hypothetical protein
MRGNYWFAAIALLGLAGVAAPARADVWSKTYRLTGTPQLSVRAGDGSVTIVSRDQNSIDVHVTTHNWRIGRDVKIEQQQNGNSINIDIRVPHESFHFFGGSHSLHVELDVPRSADLDIHTGDGSISSTPVSGNINLSSGDGDRNAQGLSGTVRLHSGDGSIHASGVNGSVRATSGDGHIELHGRFTSLQAHSGDGSIDVAALAGSTISQANGWSLSSGDGSIRIVLPVSFAADLDAHTGDGRITVGFPVTVSGALNRRSIRAKLGGGGGPLVLHSGDGSIHIEKQ